MPEQPPEIPEPELPGDASDDSLSAKEVFSYPKKWYSISGYEKSINLLLKVILFVFVIILNIWWTHRVLQLVWSSADSHARFHLSDSVLIALVTTSLANFIALVVIVAKHLFPSK